MAAAWKRADRTGMPELLAGQMTGALGTLVKAVAARDPARARQAALAAEQAALDLQLRHRAPAAVDLDRLDLWARQLQMDAAAGDRGAAAGDVAVLHTVWDRAGHTADPAAAARVAGSLRTWMPPWRRATSPPPAAPSPRCATRSGGSSRSRQPAWKRPPPRGRLAVCRSDSRGGMMPAAPSQGTA